MENKIADYKSYQINYDSRKQKFEGVTGDGDVVASGDTQKEVEEQLDTLFKKLTKSKWNFPLPVFDIRSTGTKLGRITSVNLQDKSCWFSSDEKDRFGCGRHKVRLSYSCLYEATDANRAKAEEMDSLRARISKLEERMSEIAKKFEGKIDLAFFGIKESKW